MPVQSIEEFVDGFPRAGGFVYVLTNEAHPHLQKIGFTTRSPVDRAAELDATGSPHPFVVAFALYHPDPRVAEQRLHTTLAAHRVRSEREFFALPLADAVAVIMREFGDQNYFDPLAITATGKARFAQINKDAARLEVIDERRRIARERLDVALGDRSALQMRLKVAKGTYDRARSKAGFLEFLQMQMVDVDTRLVQIQAEYDESNEEWEASGGPERLTARLQASQSSKRRK